MFIYRQIDILGGYIFNAPIYDIDIVKSDLNISISGTKILWTLIMLMICDNENH